MNSVNSSTGFSPFQLHLGCLLHILPPVTEERESQRTTMPEEQWAIMLLSQLKHDLMEAQDNLLAAKASQATQVNKSHAPTVTFKIGDHVLLATKHRRHKYIQKGDKRVAK
ncbi:hypothetical protein BDR06DRAFT_842395, partial [Suillus hirtellus]